MKNAVFILVLSLLQVLQPSSLRGQQNDFQVWPSVKANLEVRDNLKFHIEEEVRFHENASQIDRQINDFGVSYRFNKYFKAGIFYRLEADWKNADEYAWRNGLYSDLGFKYDVDRFSLGYRLRLQSSKVERNNSEEELFDGFRHRHKISVEYDMKGIPLLPFLEAELFVDYSGVDRSVIKGLRTWIGMDYTVEKKHTFTLKYGIDREIHTADPLRAFIVAVSYTLDLSLKSGKSGK